MAKTKPWYSKLKGTEVYHNDTKCTKGNNIEKKNKKSGTGGLRLCEECRNKGKKGK